jgi:hypothetical protein
VLLKSLPMVTRFTDKMEIVWGNICDPSLVTEDTISLQRAKLFSLNHILPPPPPHTINVRPEFIQDFKETQHY